MADAIMRICRKCGNEKPIDQYGFSNKTKVNPTGLRRRTCDDCYVDPSKAYIDRLRAKAAAGLLVAVDAKVCTGCGQEKPATEFHRNTAHSSGFSPRCKACVKSYHQASKDAIRARRAEWYSENRDLILEKKKAARHQDPDQDKASRKTHYEANRDSILAKKKARRRLPETKAKEAEYMKVWRSQNKDLVLQYDNRRYHTTRKFDPRYMISKRIQKRMTTCLKGGKGGRSWESLVGYTVDELEKRLRKTMPKCYTWDDFMAGRLHIDHKVPLAAHHFTSAEDIDFKRAWAISNLQLLPASENCAKGAKLSKPFQPSLTGL